MPKVTPRNVLITGVSRGLGFAMLQEFAAQGHVVWGCTRDEAAAGRLRADFKPPHDFEVVDVSDDERVAAWSSRAKQSGFVPDLVLNNAALVNRNAPLWEVAAAEFDRLVAVNVSGVANVLRHFLPLMLPRAQGVIVNFSSGWGRSTSPEVAPYCATKWAIEGLTRALAEELPKGMAAVPLNPGIIDTDMLRSCFGAAASLYPTADLWVKKAVPFLLSLGVKENGRPLSVPGQEG